MEDDGRGREAQEGDSTLWKEIKGLITSYSEIAPYFSAWD